MECRYNIIIILPDFLDYPSVEKPRRLVPKNDCRVALVHLSRKTLQNYDLIKRQKTLQVRYMIETQVHKVNNFDDLNSSSNYS